MRLRGAHRPITAHDEDPVESTVIEAEGADFETARQALRGMVPAGSVLLYVQTVGE